MSMGKEGLSNSVGDVPNLGSSMPVIPRGDPDMLLKVQVFFILIVFYHLTSYHINSFFFHINSVF